MADIATLSVLLVARDQLSGPLGKMQSKLEQTGITARKAGMAITGMGAAITGLSVLAVKSFIGFEQAIANTGAVANATASEMDDLADAAKEMGRTTVFTATQSANALSFLAMAGFSVAEATKALPGVLDLAAAAQIDLAQAADITSNVLSGYGFKVEQIARVNDVMAKAFTSANTDLVQMGEAMKLVGPVAAAAGVKFEETAGAIALLGNAGIQASSAGTTLRMAIAKMLSPTAEAESLMSKLGLTFTDTRGKLLPLVDIVRQLENSSMTAGEALTLFGIRAGPGMFALLSQGSEALRTMTKELQNAGGASAEIARRQLDTLGGQLKLVQSAVEGMAIELGSILAPIIRDIAVRMTAVVSVISDWAREHPQLTKFIVIGTAAVGALMLVLGPLLIILPLLTAGFTLFAGAVSISLGPIGLIAAGITALVFAITPLENLFIGATQAVKNYGDAQMRTAGQTNENTLAQHKSQLALKQAQRQRQFQIISDADIKGIGDASKAVGQFIIGMETAGSKAGKARDKIKDLTGEINSIRDAISNLGQGTSEAGGGLIIPDISEVAGRISNSVVGFLDSAAFAWREFRTEQFKRSKDAADKLFEVQQTAAAKALNFIKQMGTARSLAAVESGKLIIANAIANNEEATRIAEEGAARLFGIENQRRLQSLKSFDDFALALQSKSKELVMDVNSSFDDMTSHLLFQFSEQGMAWQELGGSAESILRAMVATSDLTAGEIIKSFISMQQEGETWKELLLRLDSEGSLSLANIVDKLAEMADAAKTATDAMAELRKSMQFARTGAGASAAAGFESQIQEVLRQQEVTRVRFGGTLPADVVQQFVDRINAILAERMGVLGFAHGGAVPGPVGMPQLAVVHGGEEVLTAQQRQARGGLTVNVHVAGDVIGIDDLDDHINRTVRNTALAGGYQGVFNR
jgi:TP901 family phage tail tape measure protein